jgi:hypothetical protein
MHIPELPRPAWLVGSLCFLTFGMYFLWWIAGRWRHLPRAGRHNNWAPLLNSMATLVPVLGAVRIRALFRALDVTAERTAAMAGWATLTAQVLFTPLGIALPVLLLWLGLDNPGLVLLPFMLAWWSFQANASTRGA